MKYRSCCAHSSIVGAALVSVLCVVLSATPPLAQSLERSQENGARADRIDVVVFGATPAGVTAAVAAARAGQRVRLIEPGTRVGGMVSGGLSNTDTGPRGPEVISGLTGEFFARVRKIEQSRGVCIKNCESSYFFEPHVAEQVFEDMIREAGVVLERSVQLLKVEKQGATITRLITSRGDLRASVFIDASYEGDLMALAGVPYQIGREPRRVAAANDPGGLAMQEDNAGVQRLLLPLGLHVDPYRVPGNAASGTIAFVEPRPERLPEPGEGDSRVTAYTYRLCVTDDPTNRIPFSRPDNYTASDFEVHARLAAAIPPEIEHRPIDVQSQSDGAVPRSALFQVRPQQHPEPVDRPDGRQPESGVRGVTAGAAAGDSAHLPQIYPGGAVGVPDGAAIRLLERTRITVRVLRRRVQG